ncbi:CDGSH iron-sulfur domain-containing protein [Agromyces aurantiacus]|uniref:CDGSH iron-sulfur domain-containing protein n=1 Tax=Agromyces aurantiacus TaxID=165814 RepID=A0ABV9R2D9_9MICO|nr:CDGSH iron-sulfur domain-containing protein [Agromyces aurantiacus]MBM7502975.1 CDGSH-type Zn-finger protein [Agromyces aurantiacus]
MSRAAGDAPSAGPTSITACPDGPLIARGPIELVDEHGDPIERRRRTIALCRCGASAIRPFCDGSHRTVGFRTERPARTPAVIVPEPIVDEEPDAASA